MNSQRGGLLSERLSFKSPTIAFPAIKKTHPGIPSPINQNKPRSSPNEKTHIAKHVIGRVWGAVPAPENFYISFLLSNIGYIVFGSLLLLKDDIDPATGNKVVNSSRYLRGWLMFLVGIISVIFHSNQVVHGHEDTRTSIFHILDISVAIIIMIIAIILNGGQNISPGVWVVGAASLFMFLDNKHYGLVHSLWHLSSSYVLYELLRY